LIALKSTFKRQFENYLQNTFIAILHLIEAAKLSQFCLKTESSLSINHAGCEKIEESGVFRTSFYLPHMEYEGSIGLVSRKMKFFYC
jgi:hypothetical protein